MAAMVEYARTGSRAALDGVSFSRIDVAESYKDKAYAALKCAILSMDVYSSSEPVMLDERKLSEQLGVSRTPVREALAILKQEGLVQIAPRRGIIIVRKTKAEIIEMIQAWAALESMAARLITLKAADEEIASLRQIFLHFDSKTLPSSDIGQYSSANTTFHQSVIRMSGSAQLTALTDRLILHVTAIRHRTMFTSDRAESSLSEHLSIIEALEARDTTRAERAARDHTLRLAAYVEKHLAID